MITTAKTHKANASNAFPQTHSPVPFCVLCALAPLPLFCVLCALCGQKFFTFKVFTLSSFRAIPCLPWSILFSSRLGLLSVLSLFPPLVPLPLFCALCGLCGQKFFTFKVFTLSPFRAIPCLPCSILFSSRFRFLSVLSLFPPLVPLPVFCVLCALCGQKFFTFKVFTLSPFRAIPCFPWLKNSSSQNGLHSGFWLLNSGFSVPCPLWFKSSQSHYILGLRLS